MESTKKRSSKKAALDMDARNKARMSSKKEGGILKRARWGATHSIHDHFVDGFPLLSDRFVREREAAERRRRVQPGLAPLREQGDGEAGIGALGPGDGGGDAAAAEKPPDQSGSPRLGLRSGLRRRLVFVAKAGFATMGGAQSPSSASSQRWRASRSSLGRAASGTHLGFASME
ncbi:hypothetical protein JL720_8997 [Aureococcus anophagefferens]|nr:hypothetical protein JL720_8997 [Aureococcus anophagefferens]